MKIEIKNSPNKGRGVFAAQDISKGSYVIIEKPIAVGKEDEKYNLTIEVDDDKNNMHGGGHIILR